LKKKTAVKIVAPPKSARFIRDFDDAKRLVKELELDLQKLKKKIDGLCHNPHIAGPPYPEK
jgi:hypothetical protein